MDYFFWWSTYDLMYLNRAMAYGSLHKIWWRFKGVRFFLISTNVNLPGYWISSNQISLWKHNAYLLNYVRHKIILNQDPFCCNTNLFHFISPSASHQPNHPRRTPRLGLNEEREKVFTNYSIVLGIKYPLKWMDDIRVAWLGRLFKRTTTCLALISSNPYIIPTTTNINV